MAEQAGAAACEPSVPRGAALALVAALGATLLMAAPVVLAPGERIFGSSRTFARQDPNRDPLIVIEQFRTGHVPRPYLQPLTDLPGRSLARVMGPVAAYNVIVLASFPLSAAAAYLLGRYVLGSHLAALAAGLVYAFLPFHVAHAAHHPHVSQTQWVPLYFLALWRCLDRPDVGRASLLLASAAAVTLSNFYAGLIAAASTPVALVAYAVVSPRGPGEQRWRRAALTGLTLLVAAAAGISLVHRVAPAALHDPGAFAVPRSDVFLHSAKWWSYLVPTIDHPLAGSRMRAFWAGSGVEEALLEQQVGVGWSVLALAAAPVWLWLRGDRRSLAVRSVPVLVALAGAALLCSLSPERSIGPFTFVRPSAVLYELAPMFRAYARFAVVVGLMAALLAGAGVACLRRWPTPAGRRAALALVAIAAVELAPLPPWRWRDVLPTRAHRWLAAQAGALRVLDCVSPFRASDSLAVPLLGHPVSLLGAPGLDDCGEPRLGEKLAAMGYTHVIVRRDAAAAPSPSPPPPLHGLERTVDLMDAAILEVRGEPPPVYVRAFTGFHPREYDAETTWRWMGQSGGLDIVTTRGSVGTVMELEMKAFPRQRRIEWFKDGRRQGELEVPAGWRRMDLPLGALARGRTTLTFAGPDPAVVANDVLHNGDHRALAVAVSSWSFRQVNR